MMIMISDDWAELPAYKHINNRVWIVKSKLMIELNKQHRWIFSIHSFIYCLLSFTNDYHLDLDQISQRKLYMQGTNQSLNICLCLQLKTTQMHTIL